MRSKRLILSRSQSEALRLSQALTACGIANTLTRPPRSRQMPACAWAVAIEERDRARAQDGLRQRESDAWCWEDANDLSG